MEFREALKSLRVELGVTQVQLATALHINTTTVSRWELGKTYPNPAVVSLLLGYAYTHSARREAIDRIKNSLNEATRDRMKNRGNSELETVGHWALEQTIEAAPIAILVVDEKTKELLYANRMAETLKQPGNTIGEQKVRWKGHDAVIQYFCV